MQAFTHWHIASSGPGENPGFHVTQCTGNASGQRPLLATEGSASGHGEVASTVILTQLDGDMSH